MAVQLIHKNSSVEDRRPTAAQLANGELSLNFNEAGPFLCCKDRAGNIQQLGGIKFNPDVPADAVPGTWWWNTATETLYVYDGIVWKEVGGGGGGGGSGITQILGDDGIDATVIGTVVTLNVDIERTKGLYFDLDKLAINAGANISFDADGKIQADIDTLSYKGTIDLTSDPVPPGGNAGDAFANIGTGAMSAAWQTATGLGATTVSPGDLVVKTPTAWSYIPTGGAGVQTDLGLDNRGTETLDVTSSTGDDVTIPAATDALAGLLTAADKTDLDGLIAGGVSLWDRNLTTVQPKTDGDTVAVTAADGTTEITLNPDGTIDGQRFSGTSASSSNVFRGFTTGDPAVKSSITGEGQAYFDGNVTIAGNALDGINTGILINKSGRVDISRASAGNNAFRIFTTGDSTAKIVFTNDGKGEFAGDVTINTDKITLDATNGDIKLAGDIINTVTDGDQDIICDGSGLIEVTEYNLSPMEVVTKHDIGTAANEVPLNGFLGTLAYKDDLAITDGMVVADLPTSPTARVGNIARVTDGDAALSWGETVTGGGTAQYLVWFNGTSWSVVGDDAYNIETWTPTTFTIGSQSPTVNSTSVVRSRGITTITINFGGSQSYAAGDIVSVAGIPVSQTGTGVIAGMNSGAGGSHLEGIVVVRSNGTARGRVLDAGGSINIGCLTLTLTQQA